MDIKPISDHKNSVSSKGLQSNSKLIYCDMIKKKEINLSLFLDHVNSAKV